MNEGHVCYNLGNTQQATHNKHDFQSYHYYYYLIPKPVRWQGGGILIISVLRRPHRTPYRMWKGL